METMWLLEPVTRRELIRAKPTTIYERTARALPPHYMQNLRVLFKAEDATLVEAKYLLDVLTAMDEQLVVSHVIPVSERFEMPEFPGLSITIMMVK